VEQRGGDHQRRQPAGWRGHRSTDPTRGPALEAELPAGVHVALASGDRQPADLRRRREALAMKKPFRSG
jgi:hypothetical protein